MTLDMKKMKAKYTALQQRRSGGSKGMWFRPQDGEQVIRIVPTADGDPFKEYWFHYNLGKNPGFLSPKRNFGIEDPLNDFVRQLFKDGTDDSVKMAKDLMARQRFFAPVLVRGEEDKGVRIWGFGKMAYQELLNLVLNPEYGDITDTEAGTDLVLKYGKPAGAQFPQTTLTPRRRTSHLCDEALGGPEKAAELLENIPDFDGLFTRKTPEEIQTMLDEWLAGEDEGSEDVVKYDSKGTTTSVDTAFNQLMNA